METLFLTIPKTYLWFAHYIERNLFLMVRSASWLIKAYLIHNVPEMVLFWPHLIIYSIFFFWKKYIYSPRSVCKGQILLAYFSSPYPSVSYNSSRGKVRLISPGTNNLNSATVLSNIVTMSHIKPFKFKLIKIKNSVSQFF